MSAPAMPGGDAALRRALVLEQVSLVWMLGEGLVAVASALASRSLALAAFGWDSLIEAVTAGAVLWRLTAETRAADVGEARLRARTAERVAARVVAVSLLALALYIIAGSMRGVQERRVGSPGWWGILVSAAAVVGMPVLFRAKRRVAEDLDSDAMREDAFGNLACAGMGAITLASLAAQRAGWWWADPAASVLLGAFVVREGWEAWERAREALPASARAYVILGSNMGDRPKMLENARTMLQSPAFRVVAASRVYESAPWGMVDQPRFLNQVLEVETSLTPRQLLRRCQEIEGRLGRVRATRWGPRTIDIDILLYENVRISQPDLVIPHPQLPHRAFALAPLAELDPSLRVPGAGTVRELLDALPDVGGVAPYRGGCGAGSRAAPAPDAGTGASAG